MCNLLKNPDQNVITGNDGTLEVVQRVRGFRVGEAEGGRVRRAQEHAGSQDGRPALQALPATQVTTSKVARWQNLIPSFPWIAPGWRAWGRNPRKGRDQIL